MSHSFFIVLAYGISFLCLLVLVLVSCFNLYQAKKKINQEKKNNKSNEEKISQAKRK